MTAWPDSRALPGARREIFSPYGYLFFFLGTAVAAILAGGSSVVLVLLGAVGFAAFFRARALRILGRRQLWLFIIPTLLLSPLVIGQPDAYLWRLGVSVEGFWAGLWMVARALSITLAAAIVAGTVSVSEMAQVFERMRLKGLGFAVGVATNMLPTVRETMQTSYQSIRLRGGFRSHRRETLKLLLVAVIAGSLRRGDDIVSAAEARAFDPNRSTQPSISMTRGDIALAIGAIIVASTLWLV
jgi:energy-coupling factor transporter transmembrane protein EcfT